MAAQPPPPDSRKGKARERQERRRERRQHVTKMSSSARTPRQIVPEGAFKLPEIRIPHGRTMLYYLGGVVFVIAVIVVLGLLKNNAPEVKPNVIWIGTEWTYENPDNEAVLEFAQLLRHNNIGTVYAWVSWLKTDNTWAGTREQTNEFSEVEASVRTFVEQFKLVYPEAQLYAWVSVPTNTLGIEERLGDSVLQETVAAFSKKAVDELGFDGVSLNIEQVWDGNGDYLDVLRKVRAALGTDTPIAVAVPPDWSPADPDVPAPELVERGTVWSTAYKQDVALLVDQIAVMAYHSGLTTVQDYVQWMAYQVQVYAEAIAEFDIQTELVIGIPTYDAELPAHDPAVENIPSAIEGVRLGMERAGDAAKYVSGLAIYASWETDDTEWQQFHDGWVNAK